MKAFSDDFAGIRNKDKCGRIFFFNKVTKLDRLLTVERGINDMFLGTGKRTFRITDSCSAMEMMYDVITDWFRILAYHVKVFGQIQTFDKVVYKEGADCKTK